MKRQLCLFSLLLVMLLSACSTTDSEKDDLINYINTELPKVAELEFEAIDSYGSVSGQNYTDDWTMYEIIDTVTIPAYEEFITKLESIRPKTEAVREIHEIYIEGSNAQLQGFKKIRVALEQQDYDKVFEANEHLDEGRAKIRQFQIKLEDLMHEHGVEYEDETL
ncbi:hypothetical protein M3936_10215 [Sutcliffiella horikoshii]|uniref:hypothetical protein n=1 Tax=Sutcliffiella horikoshii TaxID=79883 RepID=UPI00203E7A93|nr:hypothetical protein [Sutcliffiella horikoshii]MCM3617953.1 hypothetical protein [Sutcliffiella horikoshii]